MGEKDTKESPLLSQYYEIKAQYPDTILLYRVGDFYETFGEDAVTTSKVLGIVLTRKAAGGGTYTPLAGIPYHAIDSYLPRLVRAGYKVAVCDQLEDPKLTRKLVKRGVTELVTPGVAYNDNLLTGRENNFLASVAFGKDRSGRESGGIAFLDISTGTFKLAEGSLEYIDLLMADFAPKEIIVGRSYLDGFRRRFGSKAYISPMDEWAFVPEACSRKILERFGTGSLKGFGIEEMQLATAAAGAALFYLEMTHHTELGHLRTLSRIDRDEFVWMDRFTLRNLEVLQPMTTDGVSLLQVIDRCKTPMGSRLMRQWLALPLRDRDRINDRYDATDTLRSSRKLLHSLQDSLSEIGDMERILSKAASGRISPREVLQLARGLRGTAQVRILLEKCIAALGDDASKPALLVKTCSELDACTDLEQRIAATIREDAAAQLGKGPVIAEGLNNEIDELRNTLAHGKEILTSIQEREKEATGIPSLKISYNNIFGYYLEVRNIHRDKVPQSWIRKQTLVNAERYVTEELKHYEETILGAEEKILALEQQCYADLVRMIQEEIPGLQRNAFLLAQTDCLCSFAEVSIERKYCRPVINDSCSLSFKDGRHPVIETLMPPGEPYIANSLTMDRDDNQIIILTGPNMAGKSAFLRQSALIVLLAHAGCFVPAKSAEIGLVDKIFTRVGASDNISRGESTFMVEMTETATILNNLTDRSFVLLDEIGRGTSTFDGMSIAWAIVEYLHGVRAGAERRDTPRPKTIFATHYHELNDLEQLYPRVHNYHIAVKEADGKVIFLRKLCAGGVAHSFGIHVARMAGMPPEVVGGAERKLAALEQGRDAASAFKAANPVQLSLYQLDDPLLVEIKHQLSQSDINSMSPLDAFDLLRELKKKIGLQG